MEKLNLKPITGDPQQVKFKFIPVPIIFFEDDRLLELKRTEVLLYSYYFNKSKLGYKSGKIENNRAYVMESPKFIHNAIKLCETTIKNARTHLEKIGLIDLAPGIDNETPKVFVNDVKSLPDQELHKVAKADKETSNKNNSKKIIVEEPLNRPNEVAPEIKSEDTQVDKRCSGSVDSEDNKICPPPRQNLTTSNSIAASQNKSLFGLLLSARANKKDQIDLVDDYFRTKKKASLHFDAEDKLYCETLLNRFTDEKGYRFLCLVFQNTHVDITFKFSKKVKEDLFWIERNNIQTIGELLNYFNENHRKMTLNSIKRDPKTQNMTLEEKKAYIEARLKRTEVDYIHRYRDLLNSMFDGSEDLTHLVETISFLTTQQPNLFWHLKRNLTNSVFKHLPELTKTLIMNCLFNTTQAYRYIESSSDQYAKTALYVKRIAGRLELDSERYIRKWANYAFSESLIRAAFDKAECSREYVRLSDVDAILDAWAKSEVTKVEDLEASEREHKSVVLSVRKKKKNDIPIMENTYTPESLRLHEVKSHMYLKVLVDDEMDEIDFETAWNTFCESHAEETKSMEWISFLERNKENLNLNSKESIMAFDIKWADLCEEEKRKEA